MDVAVDCDVATPMDVDVDCDVATPMDVAVDCDVATPMDVGWHGRQCLRKETQQVQKEH